MILNKIINKLRIKKWVKDGLILGKNFQLERNSYLDSSFPWLIEIGNNVTLAPEVMVLSHDGSTQKVIGYSKIGKVQIGDNVFIGSKSIILPNTKIGNNTIIGAGSIVSGEIPGDVIVTGTPAKVVMTVEEFKKKHQTRLENGIKYDKSFTRSGKVTIEKKNKMLKEIKNNENCYIV